MNCAVIDIPYQGRSAIAILDVTASVPPCGRLLPWRFGSATDAVCVLEAVAARFGKDVDELGWREVQEGVEEQCNASMFGNGLVLPGLRKVLGRA